jgi:hypothetical protein
VVAIPGPIGWRRAKVTLSNLDDAARDRPFRSWTYHLIDGSLLQIKVRTRSRGRCRYLPGGE